MVAAPVFVGGSAANAVTAAATTAPVVVPAITGAAVGHFLIAYAYTANGGVSNWTPPDAGWQIVGANQAGASSVGGGAWYWKVATASDLSTYRFTANLSSSTAGYPAVVVLAWSSVAGVDAGPNWTPVATATTSYVAPSVTAVADHTVLLCGFATYNGAASFTPPPGMTTRGSTFNSGNSSNAVASLDLAAVGATGTKTSTSPSATGLWTSITLAGAASASRARTLRTLQAVNRSNVY